MHVTIYHISSFANESLKKNGLLMNAAL